MVLEELEQECQEMINENMAYALQYMDAYDYRMDIGHLRKEMNNLMLIYGLCDMIHRAMTLLKYFTPKSGEEYYEIIYTCFCRSKRHTDTDVMLELGMSRATFYRKKKEALRYLHGSGQGFEKFWKKFEERVDYKCIENHKLYDEEMLLEAFRTDDSFRRFMDRNKITSWDILAYRADESKEASSEWSFPERPSLYYV